MKFLIHWLLVVFTVLNPMFANAALTDYDRQEISFENLLGKYNGGFESGKANWTASGGTFTAVTSGTNLLNGKGSFTWDASASGQTLTSQAVTIPKGYYGLDCEANLLLQTPSGSAIHYVEAYDGSNVVGRSTIINSTTPKFNPVNFPCPQSGTIALRVYANADEPLIAGDLGYIGRARNVGTFQQAVYKGSLLMTGCTDWSVSNTAFTSFTATAGCSYTATGDVLSPSTFIPGFRLQNVGPGRYLILARGYFGKSVTTTNADVSFRFSDGTNTFAERVAVAAASSSGQSIGVGEITGSIGYTTAQSTLTFQLQGQVSSTASSTAAVVSDDGGANATGEFGGLQFEVFYYPTQAQSSIAVSDQGWYIDATIAGGNPSLGTSAVSSYTELTSASLTLTPRTGSAAAGIMCSSTNAATAPTTSTSTCAAGSESLGVNFNIPTIGAYKVCALFSHFAQVDQSEAINAAFQIVETPTNAQTITTEGGTRTISGTTALTIASGTTAAVTTPNNNCSIFNWSSVGTKGVRLMYEQAVTGTPNNSLILADEDGSTGQRNFRITVERINSGVNAFLTNGVVARDAVGGQVTTINTIVSKTTTYTATAEEETISASTSGGAWTLSLPAAASVKGKKYHIVQTADTANALTIDPNLTETICGQTTIIVRGLRDSITIQSDGTNWVGLDQSCWRMTTARLDCDSASTIQIDRQYSVSTIGNISGGTCAVTMPTGNYSGTPDCGANWNGNGASNDMYAVCSSATSCAVGSIGAATTAQLHFSCRGPR